MLEAAGWFCQVPPSQREKVLPRSGLLDGWVQEVMMGNPGPAPHKRQHLGRV